MSIVTTTLNYIAIHETCYNTLVVDIAHSEDLLNYRYLILLVQKITIFPFGGIFWLNPQFNKPSGIFFQLRLINSFQNFGSYMQDPPRPPTEFSKTLHIIMMVWIFSGTPHFEQQLFTYYAAESFSWNSLDLEKQFCTPESFHNLFIIDTSSGVNFTSSILPASANSSRASSWKRHMWNEKKPTNNCKDCWKKAHIARPHNAFSYDTIQIVIQGPWI